MIKTTKEDIIKESILRHESHKNHATNRPLSENYEYIGLLGEWKFGQFINCEPDLSRRLSGDKGVDFTVNNITIDIKTARKAYNLIHEEGKSFCDIYVLAQYDNDKDDITLIGWEYGDILKKAPIRDFGYGVINHYLHSSNLKTMQELLICLHVDKA